MRSFNDWFFGDFFQQNPQTVLNSGSGVLLSADGYLVTNHHVVHQAQKIEVVLANKQTYTAELVGQDPGSDLALLKIQGNNLPFMAFANSSELRVGEWVLAVGNPFNLTSTVTAGIVSAKGRNLNLLNNMFPIEAFIQTDAAINPGNSGGALINTAGLLVGINTAILSKTGSYNGYGFAIPSNIVRKVVADLKEFGKVQRAFMGAEVEGLDERLRKEAGVDHLNGVFVTSVSPIGGAREAGLQAGDVLVGMDKVPLKSKADFDEQMSYRRPGETVEISLERNGKILIKKVRLTNLNGDTQIQKNQSVRSSELGCELEPLTQYELDRLKTTHGVRIASIQSGTLSRMGIREGFVITHINKAPVKTPSDLIEALSSVRGQTVIEGFDQNGGRAVYSFYGF
ncbi:MAG: PDZ domain-containing protein [Cytophagia bacterium]|nr:PDZ domain-containing protein [Cytophagia bacterium]